MTWQTIWEMISSACISIALKLLASFLVFGIGRALTGFLIKHFPKGTKKHPLDPTASNFIKNIVKTTLYVLIAVTIVSILGVPMASIIAVVASAGAAIALALQGSLSNFASGIMLLVLKPMKLGDYIETSSVSGTVSDLGIFYTTLITPDNKHITVPNSSITSDTITNYSREKKRRLDLVFSVDYATDTAQAKAVIMEAVTAHEMVLTDPAPFVRMTAMEASSLSFTVRVWCLSENYWTLKFDLTEQVKAALDRSGISIPFPQLDVHVKS